MRYLQIFISAALLVVINTASATDLQVNISGIIEPEGSIRVSLFPQDKKEPFPQPVDVKQLATDARIEGVSVVFKNIDAGTYAISVLHDKNNNSEMDTFFGIPQEPYGNSGEYTRFKPNYEDSKFEVKNQKSITIEIKVH
ncbi:MAG: DUF2141 domain-containing protein [Gammaproteobacteria bacterium]|nr:DUF2141 domain-containing protein [Gammaproteobacteria bacterium]